MPHPSVTSILDRVDPFRAPADAPPFREEDLAALASIPRAEHDLLAMAADAAGDPVRRFAAAEALLDPRFGGWRSAPGSRRAVAGALAAALGRDDSHNRWGLPGEFAGRLGEALLGLGAEGDAALVPLLDDHRELRLEGSEAATLQASRGFRVADLAAYLLGRLRGLSWEDAADPAERDRRIAALRGS
jgi:hypothetical protein